MSEQILVAVISMIGSFTLIGVIAVGVIMMRRRRYELQAEVQTKLIDRFGTSQELVAFLQSQTGREFVSGMQRAPIVESRERFARSIGRSIVILALGLGALALTLVTRAMVWPGVILVAIGAGNLVATLAASRYAQRAIEEPQSHLPVDVTNG